MDKLHEDKGLLLLKDVFADGEDLLKSMRNLVFGLKVSPKEKEQIKGIFADKKVLREVKRKTYGLSLIHI